MKKKILMYLSLIVELVLVLSCVFSLFSPLKKYEYKEKELLVSQGENAEHYIIETPRTDLKRGSYEIRINYSTSLNSNVYTTSSDSNYYQMKIGRQNVLLSPEKEECVFTIEFNLAVDGYAVRIDSEGKDAIQVDKISIVETTSAKIKTLVIVVFLIVVVNSVWITYKRNPEFLEKKKLMIVILLGSCIFWASMPIWTPYLFSGHDLYFHLNRIEGIKNALLAGNIPARIHYSALGGGRLSNIYILWGCFLIYTGYVKSVGMVGTVSVSRLYSVC